MEEIATASNAEIIEILEYTNELLKYNNALLEYIVGFLLFVILVIILKYSYKLFNWLLP